MKRTGLTLLILLAVMQFAGCGRSDGFNVALVRGIVHIEGEPETPVPFVEVIFHPRSQEDGAAGIVGKAGRGVTNENGEFTISTYAPGDGAVIGWHEIRINVSRETQPDCPADLSRSGILETVEVVKGKNEFTFTLPKRRPNQRLILEQN